jgi:hypothetical protein
MAHFDTRDPPYDHKKRMSSPKLLRQLRQGSPAQRKANPNIGSLFCFWKSDTRQARFGLFQAWVCLITTQISLFFRFTI